eukprot:7603821-Alexandrium_andersonii.AAC.1
MRVALEGLRPLPQWRKQLQRWAFQRLDSADLFAGWRQCPRRGAGNCRKRRCPFAPQNSLGRHAYN